MRSCSKPVTRSTSIASNALALSSEITADVAVATLLWMFWRNFSLKPYARFEQPSTWLRFYWFALVSCTVAEPSHYRDSKEVR
jgi:lysylphosphatidylglycerol synthetase-like protein (DUF2156 family)